VGQPRGSGGGSRWGNAGSPRFDPGLTLLGLDKLEPLKCDELLSNFAASTSTCATTSRPESGGVSAAAAATPRWGGAG